jgi:hypothetical protein
MATNVRETSRDAKVHTANLRSEMQQLIDHLRRDVEMVDEPRAKAVFETSAEVLLGLLKTLRDYDDSKEAAFKAH